MDRITATDDPKLAQQHGLTEWDDERGQYVAPRPASEDGTTDPDGSTNKTVGRGVEPANLGNLAASARGSVTKTPDETPQGVDPEAHTIGETNTNADKAKGESKSSGSRNKSDR